MISRLCWPVFADYTHIMRSASSGIREEDVRATHAGSNDRTDNASPACGQSGAESEMLACVPPPKRCGGARTHCPAPK